MIATLGRWELTTDPSKRHGYLALRTRAFEAAQPEMPQGTAELEEAAGDFIARHVLENDLVLFEG